jgi:hypothetical protein
MTALRKPDYLTGGYKMAYLASRARHLTGDEFKALFLMVDHLGEKGCFPSQETLAEEAGYSQTTLRRMRNKLAEKGEIGFVAGGGRAVTYYSIPGLPAHTAELLAKKAPRVPKPPHEGATQGGTDPCNSPSKKEEGSAEDSKKVIELAPATGWQALKVKAPEDIRRRWLDQLSLEGVGDDGTLYLFAENPAIADWVRNMLNEVGKLGALARSVGVDPDKVKFRTRKHGFDPVPPDLSVLRPTKAGLDEAAQRSEDASDMPPEPMPPVFGGNTVSLAAYRSKLQPPTNAGREQGEHPDET